MTTFPLRSLFAALLSILSLPWLQSKSLQEYLQLSLETKQFSSLTELDFSRDHRALLFHELDLEQKVLMSIGCCSYDNGREAGLVPSLSLPPTPFPFLSHSP